MASQSAKNKEKIARESFVYAENLIKFSVMALAFLIIMIAAYNIFADDFGQFFKWYMVIFLSGLTFMPVSMMLLGKFRDSGWIISKAIGIAGSGWLMWMLSSIKVLKFNESSCWICLFLCLCANIVVLCFYTKNHKKEITLFTNTSDCVSSILLSELIFLVLFIFWTYLKCFNPDAYGTEKVMDIGFMTAMDKSEYMPPIDMWLSGEYLNYYYVGQFLATYLSKLSGVGVGYGYNLMLMLIAALGFSMPCSIVMNATSFFAKTEDIRLKRRLRFFPYFSGALAGVAVSLAGNFHYCVYAKIVPWFRTMLGIDKMAEQLDYSFAGYWFPDATRYIGYNPDTTDKTIHEFPLYSFVLGDLHAHVVNIIFVLSVVAILLGFMMRKRDAISECRKKMASYSDESRKLCGISLKEIFDPAVIAIGFFIGLFHTTNFWDYPIYFVVSGAIILFVNCILYRFSWNTIKITFFHAVVVLVVSTIVCLPFTVSFKQISTQINVCDSHTPLYQLAILWGIPVLTVVVFLFVLIREMKVADMILANQKVDAESKTSSDSEASDKRKKGLFGFIDRLNPGDLFVLTLGLCAIGLVLIPEVIYVKDIYTGDYKRANTMFKLTYQAYILFGMSMGYIIPRFILFSPKRSTRNFGFVMLLLLLWTVGYLGNSTVAWFGDYSVGISLEEELSDVIKGAVGALHFVLILTFVISFLFLVAVKKSKYVSLYVSSLLSVFVLFISLIMWCSIYAPSDRFRGIDASQYLKNVNYSDYEATNWINENIEGRPVILEANGNSYTEYNRVSARTGLPTLLGWRTHEWLWQSDSSGGLPAIVSEREKVIEELYTGGDAERIHALIDKYDISYIYLGGCERQKFENLNYEMLLSLGDVIYPDEYDYEDIYNGTLIIKVNR